MRHEIGGLRAPPKPPRERADGAAAGALEWSTIDGTRVAPETRQEEAMIRKLPSGAYRLYSRKKDPRTGVRKNLGTFKTRAAAEKHERAVQYFKRAG
jgi:hypothetical protein